MIDHTAAVRRCRERPGGGPPHRSLALCLLALLLAIACRGPHGQTESAGARPSTARPSTASPSTAPSSSDIQLVLDDVTVLNHGRPFYRGRIDLSATVARIRRGERHPHRNDGAVFQNRERRLPSKPRGYYREYVHPTSGLRGAGPQRLVVGQGGEWYYTPDHYQSFRRLHGTGGDR